MKSAKILSPTQSVARVVKILILLLSALCTGNGQESSTTMAVSSTLPSRIPRATTGEDVVSTTVQSTMGSPPPPLTEEPTILPVTTEASTNGTLSVTEAGTEDPEIDEECRVPGYASINYETTFPARVTNEHVITLEGRCYLGCMKYILEVPGLANFRQYIQRDTSYPPWPFHTLATSDQSCDLHKYVHECTRGCVVSDGTIASDASCESRCLSGCERECGVSNANECDNPDSDEWWVRQSCPLTCNAVNCGAGCYAVSVECTSSDCQPPLTPEAPPTLTPVSNGTRAGVYDVDLTQTVPSSPLLSHNVAFLFEILDLTTGNYSYHWLVHPETLDLADFSCREVSVRFAVANMNGLSEFSNSSRIPQVYGDRTRRPNPITIVNVGQVDDTRVGYFGHVTWTITWDHPQSQLHLEGYTVTVYHPSRDEGHSCGLRVWTRTLNISEPTSVTVSADEPGNLLVMNCEYIVEVHALGLDENEMLAMEFQSEIFPSGRPEIIRDLSCESIWDTTEYKFSFNLTWSLPSYIAAEDPNAQYLVSVEVVSVNFENFTAFITSENFNPLRSMSDGANETNFYYYLPHEGNDLFRPQQEPNRRFEFMLNFQNNQSNTHANLIALLTSSATCFEDAISPHPSPVQNISLNSYQLLSPSKISVNFSWIPPATPNGVLSKYDVCVGRLPLAGNKDPGIGETSFCITVNNTELRTTIETISYSEEEGSYCRYLQMRPHNEFVAGDWSAEIMMYLGAPDSCTEPATTTNSPAPDTTPESDKTDLSTPATQPVVVSPPDAILMIGVPVIVSVIALLCCCILVVSACFVARRRRRKWRLNETSSDLNLMYNGGPRHHLLTQVSTMSTDPQLPEGDEWEISPSEVLMEDSLGEGAFGEVYKGVVKGPLRSSKVRSSLRNAIAVPVAIKLLKESARGSERQDFLSEIDMMKMISEGHNSNVIGLIGCVTLQEPLSLILEYVTYGDLLSYLRTNMRMNAGQEVGDHDDPYLQLGTIEPMDLVNFSYQIASGMEYLSSLGIVHRDLACRNILVDEGKVLKITDFGMSREVDEIYVQQSKGRVPLKWMALESILTRQFTTASDVWSYGIVLWEISTMGGYPYPTVSNEDLILHLKNGYRMEKPENCSPEIYDIMLSCWDGDPSKRPLFSEMKAKFDKMLQSNAEYIYFLPINSDKACYKPENAPEGMAISVPPVRTLLSPNVAQNRMSLCLYRENRVNEAALNYHTAPRSGDHSERNSRHGSPGQRSPRSVSPAVEPSLYQNITSTVNRSTSVVLTRDASRDVRRRGRNVYVDNPSGQLQARPSSMLSPFTPSENVSFSSNSQNSLIPTGCQDDERHRRPNSMIAPSSGDTSSSNRGVSSVSQNGVGNRNGNAVIANPLFGVHTDSMELAIASEEKAEKVDVPDIQVN